MAINLLLGVKDAVVGTVDGLIDGIKYVWNNPLQTIDGVNFFSRALHSGTEENDLLVQMIKESGKELSKEFIEGDADKKARMLGQAVGEVLLALVSTKGVTAAVDAIKAGIKSGELASWFSKFSKGTATAEDIANGLEKTAETVDKADDSVKIIGNIEGVEKTWTSSDKYVGELANAIETEYPGKVVDVNKTVYRADGTPLTDYDIELDNAIIQVKQGGGKGATSQAINTASSTNKEVIVYLPDQNPGAAVVKGLQEKGFKVFTNEEDLLNYLK